MGRKSNNMYEQVKKICGFNQRILTCKYLGPTNTRDSRVKITDKRYKKSVTIPFDHTYNGVCEVAVAYLLERGWKVFGISEDLGVVIMSEWDSDKQLR
tara:strand:- start:229 stop:522 length:294 start_codon:yes stop_codon:yes gene_type:complete